MTAKEIIDLKNEIKTCEAFMSPLVREVELLNSLLKKGALTKADAKRADELTELISKKNRWLKKANEKIAAYYAPVSA